MKLIFCCPTYGPVDPQAYRAQRAAIMHAANCGHQWMGDASPDREPYASARNHACDAVVNRDEHGDATIVWMDSDVLPPVEAISRMAYHQRDFITGIYFQRRKPHWPLVANFNKRLQSFQWCVKWPENSIFPADGCGFGLCLTSVKMLRAMKTPWFSYDKFSEDFTFCLNAKAAGYQLYCDSGVICGHLPDPVPVTHDDFVAAHPEIFSKEMLHVDANGSVNQGGDVAVSAAREPEGCLGQAGLPTAEVQPGLI